MSFLAYLFGKDHLKYEGVRRINVYMLRLLYLLIALLVGQASWSTLFEGTTDMPAMEVVVWCLWSAFSLVCVFGLIHPIRMLPVVLLEIVYKVLWLVFAAYPVWQAGDLSVNGVDELLLPFLWVALPIVAVPWGYVFKTYCAFPKRLH